MSFWLLSGAICRRVVPASSSGMRNSSSDLRLAALPRLECRPEAIRVSCVPGVKSPPMPLMPRTSLMPSTRTASFQAKVLSPTGLGGGGTRKEPDSSSCAR